jgi:hypothetical protein
MHNINFVNKANFVKVYKNFVLKWLIFALYVVVVPEQILFGSIWRICGVSAMGLYGITVLISGRELEQSMPV